MTSLPALALVLLAASAPAPAPDPDPPTQEPDPHAAHAATEPSAVERLEPHARAGSGTAWQPEDTPVFAVHGELGGWTTMVHGGAALVADRQTGERGVTRGVAPNWIMGMAQRPLGERGGVRLRGMLSLDPATVRPRGTPQLFQAGETFRGRPLVDAQHPHDLFMELSATGTWAWGPSGAVQVYAAPVGEPALGPVAFMHRVSGTELPTAVLAHHQQDATHISFGVLTAGVLTRRLKVEGSWFNGHEPDEERWGFDPLRLNSTSARVTWAPGPHWALQVSRGELDSPEELAPGVDVARTTASVLWSGTRGDRFLSAAAVWGRNVEEGSHHREDGTTLELTLGDTKGALFGRLERVDRHGLVDTSDPESEPFVAVHALTVGAVREITELGRWPVGLGGMVTAHAFDDVLDPVYGSQPVGLYLFLRVRAPRMGSGPPAPEAHRH